MGGARVCVVHWLEPNEYPGSASVYGKNCSGGEMILSALLRFDLLDLSC